MQKLRGEKLMDLQLLAGIFVGVFASGFLPWAAAEIIIVSAALLISPQGLVPLLIVSTTAQMLAKTTLYMAARWTPQYLPAKARNFISQARCYTEKRRAVGLIVLSSSLLSLPPFYAVAIASGTLRVPFGTFFGIGYGGMIARYAFFVWGTALVGSVTI
jgi:membrane protein YqaA with SNARE-associated domain